MLVLPAYQVLAQVYESANSIVYRATRRSDGQPVILKLLKQNYPTPEELVRYRQEYYITHHLNIEGICRALSLEKYQNTVIIVFEDFGGESLKVWITHHQFNLEEFLEIAIATTESLRQIHAANIIHKDINPANIAYNPLTKELKIIDFGISTILSKENPTLKNPHVLEGTLAYMSPEQTGRMNRSLDYRTDFYSLGVTFYELLTNKLPFDTDDVLELVHCHIAKKPPVLGKIKTQKSKLKNEVIPQVLSDIVMKLMAKNAEDRYQSALGIKADLEQCLHQLQNTGEIATFALAAQDIDDKFQIPQKLYGRAQEINTLMSAFEEIADRSQIILVAGYSGIGKSKLVQELYKPITEKRGYFISGKFDQYQRNIPYSAIVNAFGELVKQLLTEPEAQLQQWRQKILAALGSNAKLIIDVIPEVELILGQQPPIAEIGGKEAQNRLNLVFQNLIEVFTKCSYPLAIFLDDLQWADGASLKLIEVLMNGSSSKLFLIGAYRDNEVSSAHPLMLTLDAIRQKGISINQIFLSPLDLPTVTQLIGDTLKCSEVTAQPLAELVIFKTGGNPFFIKEFITSLYTEELLEFNFHTLHWQWNLEQIQGVGFTDNVVELMTNKIQKLPETTQEMLKIAACIGNQFDLKILANSCNQSLSETANILWSAIEADLIVSLSSKEEMELALINIETTNPESSYLLPEYKFVHDRIQQAAYTLIPESQKPIIHQQIGEILWQNIPASKLEEKIFDIVNQLNFGKQLISTKTAKERLAKLNLQAGKKAKSSAAYQPAYNYLQTSRELLAKNSWQNNYELTLEIYVEAAETAYLKGDFEEMEKLIQSVLNEAKTVLEKVKIIEVKILALIAQGQLEPAIKTGLKFLRYLGEKIPQKPNKFNIWMGFLETKLALVGKKVEDLVNLPPMKDPYKLASMRILSKIVSPSYLAAFNFFLPIVFKQVILSVKYGNCPESTYAYAVYGLILCGVVGDIESGYEFGEMSLKLVDKLKNREFKTKALFIANGFIGHWKKPAQETLQPLLEAYKTGIETGDLEYAAYAAHVYSFNAYLASNELAPLASQMSAYSQMMEQLNQNQALSLHKCFHQGVLNLLDQAQNPCDLIGNVYDDRIDLPLLIKANARSALCYTYLNKLILSYLFEKYPEALSNAIHNQQYLTGGTATFVVPNFYFYDSLTQLSLYNQLAQPEQRKRLQKVRANQKKMKKWAHHAPINYLHKYILVEAEKYRVLGKEKLAIDFYERAINLARNNDYMNETALAYELAAKFYLSTGKYLSGKAYMQEARYCYHLWGANAKVKDLEQRYPQLLTISQTFGQDTQTHKHPTRITTRITTTLSSNLDIATLMKATQAISGEIVLDKLLSRLMKIMIENAGAQKGYLIFERQGELLIEAEGTINDEQVILQSIALDPEQTIPLAIAVVNYVARTQESVVLANASQEGKFTNDPYIKQNHPKSILCVPLINQGKVISIVYLENHLTTGAFTPDRLEVVKLLSGQAATSIENAKLYTEVCENERRLAHLTEELFELNKAYERFVPRQFLQLLEKDSLIDVELGDQVQLEMSVLFSDIRGFTPLSEKMTPEENFQFINSYLIQMEPAITENHGFIDKYIGDAIMALFSGRADNAVKASISMLHRLAEYNQHRIQLGDTPIHIGIGINTGSLMLGTVGGKNRMDGTVISDAVNLASRIETLTKEYGVSLLISQQTYSHLENPQDYLIRQVDKVTVKGKSEIVTVYEVFDADPPIILEKKLATLQTYVEACSYFNLQAYAEAAQKFDECLLQNPGDRVTQIYKQRCQSQIMSQ